MLFRSIGGGYTGLSTALHLARDHGVEVRLLESGHIGWGASGRNGGFCCLPATKLSIKQLIARYGLEETKRFYAAQIEGMELVRNLGEEEQIDFDRQGDGNLEVAHRPSAFAELEARAETLTRMFGIETRLYSREEFRAVGHDSTEQFGAMLMAVGFALHPLKLAAGLGRRRGEAFHDGPGADQPVLRGLGHDDRIQAAGVEAVQADLTRLVQGAGHAQRGKRARARRRDEGALEQDVAEDAGIQVREGRQVQNVGQHLLFVEDERLQSAEIGRAHV